MILEFSIGAIDQSRRYIPVAVIFTWVSAEAEAEEGPPYIGVLGIWVLGGRDVEIGRPLNTSVVFDMPEREVEFDMPDYAAKRGVPIREVEIEV